MTGRVSKKLELNKNGMPIQRVVLHRGLGLLRVCIVLLVLNWVMTNVMLTVVWVFLIIPTRVLIKLFGSDPLKREWSSEESTYWEEPDEQPDNIEAYFRQF